MAGKQDSKLKRWELALLLAVAFTALLGARLGKEQDALAEKVIRLHVVANSDSEADQALKQKVRDAVLQESSLRLTGLDREAALKALNDALPDLGRTAADTVAGEGYCCPVRVSLGRDTFPTKSYDGVSLPAGEYTALRIELGEGAGRNWWCVIFPQICLASTAEPVEVLAQSGLTGDQIALVTGESQGYVVKFRAIELWEDLKKSLSR